MTNIEVALLRFLLVTSLLLVGLGSNAQNQEQEMVEEKCSCWSNSEQFEFECSGDGQRTSIETCLVDKNCHWGPSQMPKCQYQAIEHMQNMEMTTGRSNNENMQCTCEAKRMLDGPVCQNNKRKDTIEGCLADSRCRWGPSRNPECREEAQDHHQKMLPLEDQACECKSNEDKYDFPCQQGERKSIDVCLVDYRCHWGPAQNSKCQREQRRHQYLQDQDSINNNKRPHDVGCYSNWVRTLYFHSGEKDLGAFDSVSQCIEAAKEKCKGYDLVNVANEVLPNEPVSSCWCQYSRGLDLEDYYDLQADWQTCNIREIFKKDKENDWKNDEAQDSSIATTNFLENEAQIGGNFDQYDDICECFANEEQHQSFCEIEEMLNVDLCLIDNRCHWGPAQLNICQQQVRGTKTSSGKQLLAGKKALLTTFFFLTFMITTGIIF